MQDKTALGISDELRQYIEALVKEVVLEGKPFDDHKKWLERFSENEYVDYAALEKDLMVLFKTAEEIKSHESIPGQTSIPCLSGWSLGFVEQMRCAYCRKDIDFLEKVFSPNSQIITGAYILGKDIRYRTQGKLQYLANLRYIFAKNKNINVSFYSDDRTGVIYESAEGRCLVVRLIQDWHSDNYADRGYLSLLLCTNNEGPKVLIRAWQPIKN